VCPLGPTVLGVRAATVTGIADDNGSVEVIVLIAQKIG